MTEADVLITAALAQRPARQPDLAAQNQALHALARQLTEDPPQMLKTLVRIARDLCACDTAGVSLWETASDGTKAFRWVAIAGALESWEQRIAPGNFSPCAATVQCPQPQLYARPELYFTYLHHPQFPIAEGLLLPICANDRQLGTLWILSHSEQRQFDREDQRLAIGLAGFAAAALQSINQRQAAEGAREREQAARLETEATRQALNEEAQRAVDILESITDAFVSLDRQWRITYVNRAVARMNNLQPQEMIGKTHWEIWPWSVGTIVEQTYRQVVVSQAAAHFEVLYEPLKMWLEIHAYPAPAGLSIYFRDITARKQAELLLVEQKKLLELTASGQPLEECLWALCASMSELNPHVRACVLLTDARRQTFKISIASDLPPSFGRGLKDAPVNELAIGTCGGAVYCSQPVTCADIANDGRWSQERRDLCLAHGVLACHWAPILGVDRLPLGSLMLCFGEARMPIDWEYRLAEFGTQIASIAIERDRSSLALRESEAKYRTIAELSTHHVWMLDAAGEVIFLNQTFLDYFGKPLHEVQRSKWAENVHHPDDRDRVVQEIARAMAAGTNIRSEHRLRRHDNQFRWFLNQAHPLRDANGEITHWLGASVDIHDSKQAADALRQMSGELERQVQKFDAIATSVPDFIYTFDLSGRFTYVNPAFLDLLQKTSAEALGKNCFELDYPTDLATRLQNQIQQVIETRQPLKDEAPYASAFGTGTYEYIFVPLYGANGAVEAVAGVTRDITDRFLAEAALRDSEEKFRNMADNAPFMVWVTDPEGCCTYLSQSWYDFTGQTPETGLGFGWWNAIHPVDREYAQQAFQAANERQDVCRVEYRLRRSDGEYIWAIGAASPWLGANGQFKGYIGSIVDIDERKQTEEALRESEARFRQMADSAPMLVWMSGTDKLCNYFNQPWLDFTGRTAEQELGNGWAMGVHPDDFQRCSDTYTAAFDARRRFEMDYRLRRNDGEYRWIIHAGVPRFTPEGKFLGYIGSCFDIHDRKQALAALRRSEERYRTLFESIDEGFCVIEVLFDENDTPIDYRFLEVNPAFEKQTGLQQAAGKTIRQLVPNIEDRWVETYGKIALTGEPARFENGSEAMNRWFDIYAFGIGQPDERKVAILFADISDRKRIEQEREQAEKALLSSEEQSRNILESITDGFFALDRNWRFTYANPQAERLLDRTPGDLLGKVVWEEYPGIAGSVFERAYRQAADERVASSVTSFYPDHNRWYEVHVYPAANGITIYFRNVTARKRVEEELRQKNAILEVINESAPSPIFVKDREGRIIYANPATLKVLGKSATEVIGYRDCDLYASPELGARVTENDRRIMASGRTEVVEESPDGIRTFLTMKAPYRNESGEVIGLIGLSYDISDRVQVARDREGILQREQAAREAAETANRIKDEFLAVLSHELRSPLNPILGWAKLLRSGKLDAVKTGEALATIERNAQLQSQLIEDLLDISRIMRGKLTLNSAAVSLAPVIWAAVETVRLAAEAKSIEIEVCIEPNVRQISGDAARLQQVVWNLLSNAVKFTPTKGRVEVCLTQTDRSARLQVTDTGKGINSEFLPYVFEHFRQEDGATTRQFGGLGLGLAIARQLVELHGGRIWVESKGENQGAAFAVELPLLQAAAPMAVEVAGTTLSQSDNLPLARVRVLVVDDEPDSREFAVFVAQEAGASVIAVGSAIEALQLLLTAQFDILLCDIGMPEMDGYALMREIRQLQDGGPGQIPAIALTAYAGEVDRQQAIAAGFQSHLAKPVDPVEIVTIVARLCRPNRETSA